MFKAGANINIPAADCHKIVTDGKLDDSEWKDAILFAMRDDYNIFLKADEELFAIGLKFPKPMGELICEVRVTVDDQEVFLLHSSGGIGEGNSGFPATSKYTLNYYKLWEGSFSRKNPLQEAEWIAAGEPIEKYDSVYYKRDGIEFRFARKKFSCDTLKLTIGWVRVEIKDGKPEFKQYNYPKGANLLNSNNWAKLILPEKLKPKE